MTTDYFPNHIIHVNILIHANKIMVLFLII